ncbi:MAG: hypothetical protein IKQ46_00735 [Bacteroidales bacterium]|nr:hypothetical protein [Bacteroidales bacterium]
MNRFTLIAIMLILSLGVMAQNNDDVVLVGYGKMDGSESVRILMKSQCCPAICSNIFTDKKTKKTIGVWDDLEMGYIKDSCQVAAPVSNDFSTIFPGKIEGLPKEYSLLYWMLTEENDETVLHCYFTMPADEMRNLWLACEETAIVDMNTGVQYRAKRTAPECFRKHFSVKAPVGTPLDFKIYFPKLDPTTKEIAIYGVPMWGMRGTKFQIISSQNFQGFFDNAPQIKKPTLVKEANNYNKDKYETWAVYNNPHLIKPVNEGTMALWNTPEATYIAVAHEQNWTREYYGIGPDNFLIDDRGHKYKIKNVYGVPLDQIFWIEAYSGDFIAFIMEFEPLPPNLQTFTYIVPEGEKFDMWGASWDGKVLHNLNVNELRANQPLFVPIERVIKE